MKGKPCNESKLTALVKELVVKPKRTITNRIALINCKRFEPAATYLDPPQCQEEKMHLSRSRRSVLRAALSPDADAKVIKHTEALRGKTGNTLTSHDCNNTLEDRKLMSPAQSPYLHTPPTKTYPKLTWGKKDNPPVTKRIDPFFSFLFIK